MARLAFDAFVHFYLQFASNMCVVSPSREVREGVIKSNTESGVTASYDKLAELPENDEQEHF